MTPLQSTSTPASNRAHSLTPSTERPAWESESSSYTLKTTENRFTDAKARDIKSGTFKGETEKLVDAVLMPGKTGLPKVQVKTFAVDGIQSKDMIVIERVPAEPNRPNIVLFMPEKEGNSFISFDNKEQMDKWLKEVATAPNKLEKFSAHFSEGGGAVRDKRVKEVMTQYGKDDLNAIVGPYVHVQGNIFERLDREINSPPASVNGLTHLQQVKETDTGRTLYSGQRPDGEKVLFEYDAYGNLLGTGNKGNYYFLQNGINSNRPLTPMTQKEYEIALEREISKNVGADDLRGLFNELVAHLEHPFQGIGEALKALGVNASVADTIERYLDNPFSALLLDLNTNNQIGKVFGLDKATMDGILKGIGDIAQGFVPFYGQTRMLGSLLAKAIRNEPLNNQEQRDLADALALKPDSLARKNIPAQSSEKHAGPIQSKFKENTVSKVAKGDEPPALNTDSLPRANPTARAIEFNGAKYFVADKPDAGDGIHYVLRVAKPDDPTQMVSSGKIARPDDSGVWVRRGVIGGGRKTDTLQATRQHLQPRLDDIKITDTPSANANGVTQYKHDGNHLAVMQRRDQLRKEFQLDNYGAVRSETFQTRLAQRVGAERDANGKIFGQCAEMAAYAADTIKKSAKDAGYHTYMVQIPSTNHTVVLLSRNNYPAGAKIDWSREFASDSITVDLWQAVLNKNKPTVSEVLSNTSKKHLYTKDKPAATIQVEMKVH